MQTIRWEVDVVLTDRSGPFLQLRKDLHGTSLLSGMQFLC